MIKFVVVSENGTFSKNQFNELMDYITQDRLTHKCIAVELESLTCTLCVEYEPDVEYRVQMEVSTHIATQMVVLIESQKHSGEYDLQLEHMKIQLKDWLLKTWDHCIWLTDDQVLELSAKLYSQIHRTENRVRQFTNSVMISLFGVSWWDNLVRPHLNNVWKKHQSRQAEYKRDVPKFKNVSDNLLGINTDDLWSILTLKLTKWNAVYDPKIETAIRDRNSDRVFELVRQQMDVHVDLWSTYFSICFDPNFESEWSIFIKNRNHVAHNKSIDYSAFSKIYNNIQNVYDSVEEAERRFFDMNPSQEVKSDLYQMTYEDSDEDGLEEVIEESTGITVHSRESIRDKFVEAVDYLRTSLEDAFYFRDDIVVKAVKAGTIDLKGIEFLSISSNILKETSITLQCCAEIDDERGGESKLVINLLINGAEVESCTATFTNGDYAFDQDRGYYVPVAQDVFHDKELQAFEETAMERIETKFPNLLEEAKAMEFLAAIGDIESPYSEFPCNECGEMTVSVNSELCSVGTCISCGYADNLTPCTQCGGLFNVEYEGSEGLCDDCSAYVDAHREY